ncbi:hypothetical protein J2Q11_13625 [Tenacibaculum finnmarkense genomovar finnmarkense]|uniref:Uncharacterized protein n=1 Tax=Tenacibaculum finnmarkense genomovar finnmarkense TaxID=1458503 RepID=A0AAP1RHB0_9FLAO|nr:hypothetical protein [Tenacibaculum finnmarkense]MBE7646709.1 hypothetical protein [Tenacibaculum finnmarkense genomovar ulcerans]MBE7653994.1 hypothetical protein [Tenacibaculum finnmarkense genomovar finnmarkense]MBE7661393.1 hypothetical protein [Tenacibaculum finnmarkense genomovar finnmarkense]MBE7696305.1 hypothetical protein [Tenacibaculum finnmarkense genomovar finnmarkense]MCD8401376.1 hypothetical protein [Tenacibaculum finnmarkense genomovar ulcerans]
MKKYFLKNILFFVLLLIGIKNTYAQATFSDNQTVAQLAGQLQVKANRVGVFQMEKQVLVLVLKLKKTISNAFFIIID